MKGQDDLSRRRRLNEGRCPTHGTGLIQTGIWHDTVKGTEEAGPVVECPRNDCEFRLKVKSGTKTYHALCGGG